MKKKYYAKKIEICLLSLYLLCGDARSAAVDGSVVAVLPEHMRAVYCPGSSERDSATCPVSASKIHIMHDSSVEDNFEAIEPGRVRVVYFSKKGRRYSTTYDVRDSKIYMDLSSGFRCKKTILPLQYALQLEYLKGYILNPGCSAPNITDAAFSHKDVPLLGVQNMTGAALADKDVDLRDYYRQWFFSELIETFLVKCCKTLATQGHTYSDDDSAALITDMPKTVRQAFSFKKFSWGIVSDGRAAQVEKEGKYRPQILIFIGGVGVLWGKLTNNYSGDTWPHSHSLHCYKVKGAANDICAKYPFSPEELRKCIN